MKVTKSEKGQILVATLVLMFLSLALGISISGGFISNLRNQAQSDEASKAAAAADALVEKLLLEPTETLEEYIANNSCGSACTWSVTDTTGQLITATATLSYAGNTSETFTTDLSTTMPYQLNLRSYTSGKTLDICWDTPASIYASYIKEASGVLTSKAYAYNAADTGYPENGLPLALAKEPYASCFTVTATDTPTMLRLKTYYLNTQVYIIPESGEVIPKQGVLITSTGKSGTATRKVYVLKSTGTLPSQFDYAIYQKSSSAPLSNVTL